MPRTHIDPRQYVGHASLPHRSGSVQQCHQAWTRHQITINLATARGKVELTIEDDGVGIPETPSGTGMGLHIMNYRAKTIGATIESSAGFNGWNARRLFVCSKVGNR